MENRPPEARRPEPRMITVEQEFLMFPPGESANFILNLEDRVQIPFEPHFAQGGTILDTVTPYEPELGYQITNGNEDFDAEGRFNKLQTIINEATLDDAFFLNNHNLLTISSPHIFTNGVGDDEFTREYFERLGLLVEVNGLQFVGPPVLTIGEQDEVHEINYYGFVPKDFGRKLPFHPDINPLITQTFEKMNMEPEFYAEAFNIGIPRGDREKAQGIQGRFFQSPTSFSENE